VLVERWESQAALEEHLRSETYRRILGAIVDDFVLTNFNSTGKLTLTIEVDL
jgi:quinol monooxygenase YgiN